MSRFFADDMELGKKNDDFRPKQKSNMSSSVQSLWRGPRKRRIFFAMVGLWLLYIFWKNIPTDVPPVGLRGDNRFPYLQQPPAQAAQREPPLADRVPVEPGDIRDYEGPIRFYELAETLTTGAAYGGISPVVFVTSSPRAVASLVPLACDMAFQKLNNVHMLILGRHTLPLATLKELNGVNDKDCPMLWHDGRPDFTKSSTDLRMEIATKAALGHFNTYLKPKVVLIDAAIEEEAYFLKGTKAKTTELGLSLIELPENAATDLHWITRLDSVSLQAWNAVDIEILVHVPSGSSGGLIRLLESITAANYAGGVYPKVTIELPNKIETPIMRFLLGFSWPPRSPSSTTYESKLNVRHRLSSLHESPEEASIRTVEAFFPTRPSVSHVLVLSPNAELSPTYFHYLKFLALKYKHSMSAAKQKSNGLLGISLDSPTTQLDGKTQLASNIVSPPLLLWQSPNSNAALYFGDKWAELHSFLSDRLIIQRSSPNKSPKLVSETYPAWIEYLLELTRLRSYYMLYPSFASSSSSGSDTSLATIHQELYTPPEEFTKDTTPLDAPPNTHEEGDPSDTPPPPPSDPSLLDVPFHGPPTAEPSLLRPTTSGLLSLFGLASPGPSDLVGFDEMTLITWDGQKVTNQAASRAASTYIDEFAVEKGGCKDAKMRKGDMKPWSADDLFCLPPE